MDKLPRANGMTGFPWPFSTTNCSVGYSWYLYKGAEALSKENLHKKSKMFHAYIECIRISLIHPVWPQWILCASDPARYKSLGQCLLATSQYNRNWTNISNCRRTFGKQYMHCRATSILLWGCCTNHTRQRCAGQTWHWQITNLWICDRKK